MQARLSDASSFLAILALLIPQTKAVQDAAVGQQTAIQMDQAAQAAQADETEGCPFGRPYRSRRGGPFGPGAVRGAVVIDELEAGVRAGGSGCPRKGGAVPCDCGPASSDDSHGAAAAYGSGACC